MFQIPTRAGGQRDQPAAVSEPVVPRQGQGRGEIYCKDDILGRLFVAITNLFTGGRSQDVFRVARLRLPRRLWRRNVPAGEEQVSE